MRLARRHHIGVPILRRPGLSIEVFDGLRKSLAENRAQFYREFASTVFYGYNRPGAKPSDGVIDNWWRPGMMDGTKAHYDGIKAFSETDLTEDLKSIDVPTLIIQGDDDQVVPYKGAALLQAKLIKNATLKLYPGFPHGMLTAYCDTVNRTSSPSSRREVRRPWRRCRPKD